MPIDLRAVMRHLATGVCMASTYAAADEGLLHDAVTINSLTSVSLDPPLVSFCLRHGSSFLDDLVAAEAFGVSILDVGSADLAGAFAAPRHERKARLGALSATLGAATGALVVDSPAWMECRLHQHFPVGDHTMVIGEVISAGTQRRRPPLVFVEGTYRIARNISSVGG